MEDVMPDSYPVLRAAGDLADIEHDIAICKELTEVIDKPEPGEDRDKTVEERGVLLMKIEQASLDKKFTERSAILRSRLEEVHPNWREYCTEEDGIGNSYIIIMDIVMAELDKSFRHLRKLFLYY
jgi:hypothetical protein